MHETSVCQGIIDIVWAAQKTNGFAKVRRLRIEIGALSCVDPQALRRAFVPVAAGTPAEDATLEIDEPPGQAWCINCQKTVSLPERGQPCPDCGGYRLMVQGGDEMRVKDMEVV